ncbi:hypothetical protein [Microcoleus sp. MON2_D5]|uniref:hypothetical protein n=1 Tax=Microcoleus sp. MON2_D5 TaxID=2818833 RepID=UPI002FD25251
MTTLLTAKFAQVDASILDIQTQIASLQAKLTALQDYRQQLQSVEQACESALSQVDTALIMLHHVDASQVGTFKDAIDIKFAPSAIGILEPATTTPAEAIEPEPTAPTAPEAPVAPDTDSVIDVEATTDIPTADEPIEPTAKATPPDIEGMLNKMTIQSIRKLAAAKGADGKGTRASIAARLKKIVTESDIWDATA